VGGIGGKAMTGGTVGEEGVGGKGEGGEGVGVRGGATGTGVLMPARP